MAELTSNAPSPGCVFGTKAGSKPCKLPSSEDTGTSSQILKAVYVRYRDQVFFKNVKAPTAEAIIREALGWVKKEDDEVMLLECDRPLLPGFGGFNGVVVIKNCIVSMVSLDFEHVLNCPHPLLKDRVCASSQGSEKLSSKIQKRSDKN